MTKPNDAQFHRSAPRMLEQLTDRVLDFATAHHMEWTTALIGWFTSLKPVHQMAIATIAVSTISVAGWEIGKGIWSAPAGVEALNRELDARFDTTNARVRDLEGGLERLREDVQQFTSMQLMVNELFCDRFPTGSPSGVRCQLTAVPIR